MRARGRFAVIFFVASVAASAALFAGACGRGGRERAERQRPSHAAAAVAPARRELSPLPRRELSPALARAHGRAMRSASAARGLAFKSEPGMTELTGWEYGARAGEMTALLGGDELRSLSRLAVAGGLLPEGTDLATLAASFTAASSSAIYSPLDRRVLLLDAGTKSARRADHSLLAHELTHALQDQHFDLLRLLTERPYNFDRAEAVFALIEGDAVAVQRRVERGPGGPDPSPEEAARGEDARFAEYRREFGALFPALLTETFVFRYRDGVRFVETARKKGGGALAADELFRRPPASSEQVLHPEKYFADERPREVRLQESAFAAANWRLATSTPLGEIGVRGLLLKALGRREAERAAAGWGGDRAYLFEREAGGQQQSPPLFVWRTAWDTAGDAQEFFRAYSLLERRSGATEEQTGPRGARRKLSGAPARCSRSCARKATSSQSCAGANGKSAPRSNSRATFNPTRRACPTLPRLAPPAKSLAKCGPAGVSYPCPGQTLLACESTRRLCEKGRLTMKHTLKNFSRLLCALALVGCAATFAGARDRDQARVISARAGGVNHVAGDVTLRRAGASEWKRLTTSDNLKSGDTVRTGADGRAEILLNPGSYLRLGHDSEFAFAETSLDRLRLKLASGSAVVEATGFSDIDVLVTVETPEAQVSILRSGLYRFNAARAGATEVFVYSGRAGVGGALVKGGHFVRVSRGAGVVVATKFDKKQQRDALDLWSRERARELAQINDRLQRRNVNTLLAHMSLNDQFFGRGAYGHLGVWLWSPFASCYTFLPFAYGWPSPYGFRYGTGFSFYNAGFCTPCLHPRLRHRWDVPVNHSPWDGGNNGGAYSPGVPKSSTAADWKQPSPASAPGGSRTTTERTVGGDAGSGKGDKP